MRLAAGCITVTGGALAITESARRRRGGMITASRGGRGRALTASFNLFVNLAPIRIHYNSLFRQYHGDCVDKDRSDVVLYLRCRICGRELRFTAKSGHHLNDGARHESPM